MSVVRIATPEVSGSHRAQRGARPARVRHRAREVVLVMAFSASMSLGVALLVLVGSGLGH